MPKNLQKSLQDYLSKIKKPTPDVHFHSTSLASSTNWIFSGCKHTKTLSFAVDDRRRDDSGHDHHKDDAATLSDVDRFLFENFKSLYGKNDDNRHKKTGSKIEGDTKENAGGFLFDSPRFDLPPDLCGSNRFFVRPGMSSSLMEEARSSGTASEDMPCSSSTTTTTTTSTSTNLNDSTSNNSGDHHVKELASLSDECIAISTYSPNPYDDFRRSMHEMIEARVNHHGKVDWDFMEELLFCYLNLNDKKSYKYILSAFVDLIVALRRSNSRKAPARSRRVRIAGERRKKRVIVT